MPARNVLYLSMLGETAQCDPRDFTPLCPSGLEKDWILDWHAAGAARHGVELRSVDIIRGAAIPPPERIDAAILGGTIHLITEDRPWLKRLLAWMQAYRRLERPLLGICGGHQMMAVHFCRGVELVERPQGLLTGTYPVDLTAAGRKSALFHNLAERPRFHFANSYHVVPAGDTDAVVLASTPDSPAVAVDFGGRWYGTQFHPESRTATWECFYARRPDIDLSHYTLEQAGGVMIDNFLRCTAIES